MKFILITLLILFVPAVIWYYLPEPVRHKTTNFIVDSSKRDSGEFVSSAKETFLPKSPAEKQKEIVAEIKKNLETISEHTAKLEPVQAKEVSIALEKSEKLIENLQAEIPRTPTIVERALDIILPSKAQECK